MPRDCLKLFKTATIVFAGLIFLISVSEASWEPIDVRVDRAEFLEKHAQWIEARSIYDGLIQETRGSLRNKFKKKYQSLNVKLLFSDVVTPESKTHLVKAGESLKEIAKKHKSTVELIKKSNRLANGSIHPGMKLKVVKGKFSIIVDKSDNRLTVMLSKKFFKEYRVATGEKNKTPVGKFKITTRIQNPTWYKDKKTVILPGSPENDLGTRWLGLNYPSHGIHGTTDPKSIGTQASAGCVRMHNRDVEELFIFIPSGTEVTITN